MKKKDWRCRPVDFHPEENKALKDRIDLEAAISDKAIKAHGEPSLFTNARIREGAKRFHANGNRCPTWDGKMPWEIRGKDAMDRIQAQYFRKMIDRGGDPGYRPRTLYIDCRTFDNWMDYLYQSAMGYGFQSDVRHHNRFMGMDVVKTIPEGRKDWRIEVV